MSSSVSLNDRVLPSPSGALSDRYRQFLLILLGGTFAAAVRGAHHPYRSGTLLVDTYWTGFYLLSYQDGFRRRALVGSVVRLLEPVAVDVRLINIVAVLALTVILVLFLRTFLQVASLRSQWTDLFAFAIFASCLLSVYFEVLGDTLQIAMLLFLAIAAGSLRWVSNSTLRLALGLAGLVMGFFIHEASIFFLAPCIPFLVRGWPRIRDFIVPALGVVCLLALSIHWSAIHAHMTYHVATYPQKLALDETVGTPTFKELFHEEIVSIHKRRLAYALKYLKMFSVLVAVLIALSHCIPRPAMKRIVFALLAILLFSVPLFAIAHDWGRFLGYDLFLALMVTSIGWTAESQVRMVQPHVQPLDRGISPIVDWVNRLALNEPMRLAAVLLLLISPYDWSRQWVVASRTFLACAGILGVALIMKSSGSRAEQKQLEQDAA